MSYCLSQFGAILRLAVSVFFCATVLAVTGAAVVRGVIAGGAFGAFEGVWSGLVYGLVLAVCLTPPFGLARLAMAVVHARGRRAVLLGGGAFVAIAVESVAFLASTSLWTAAPFSVLVGLLAIAALRVADAGAQRSTS